MFLRRGPLACLYFIALLSFIESHAVARSTSFLPFASAVWGSTSTSPSLAPTSNPPYPKKRRKSKRRRRVSNQAHKPNIEYGERDSHEPKRRSPRRKRKASSRATQDLSRSLSHEIAGSAARTNVTPGRIGRKPLSQVSEAKTKRRRSSMNVKAQKSTETRVRKTKKRIKRKSSNTAATTVAPSEKRKDESDLESWKKRQSKRRKIVTVDSHPPPKSMPVKAPHTKKRKVKRAKKRSLASPKIISHDAEPEESDESKMQPQILTKDENDVETVPIPDDSKGDTHFATSDEILVQRDDCTKKRKVKRTKKRSLASPQLVSHDAEPEDNEEPTMLSLASPQLISHDAEPEDKEEPTMLPPQDEGVNICPPIANDSKDDPHEANNNEVLVERDDDSTPTIGQNIQQESAEEQLSVEVEGKDLSTAAPTISDDDHCDISASATEGEPTTSTANNALVTDGKPEDANTECPSHTTMDANTSTEVKEAIDEVPVDMSFSTNVETEVTVNEEEAEKQKVDGEELDTVVVTEHDEDKSIVHESSVQAGDSPVGTEIESEQMSGEETAIQTPSPLEGSFVEASIDEDTAVKQEPDVDPEDRPPKEGEGVVDFIEDILQEDVKSWVTDSSSDSESSNPTSVMQETRGGHQDASTSTNTLENDETKSLQQKDSSDEPTEKESKTHTSPEDTTTETISLYSSILDSCEDCETDIAVSVVTWNLAEVSPAEEDAAFIRKFRKSGTKKGSGSDLVLISGQECENIKPRRSEGSRSREFRRLMIKMLGKQYVPVALHLLGGIQFGLFAKRSFLKEIEEIAIADVTCGIGNVFHNKGAIAAFLKVKARNPSSSSKKARSLRMVFVTAHMAAHVKNVEARNADFWRISSELEAQAPEGFLPEHGVSTESENESFLFDSVDRVFFCGDLNYRVDLPRELAEFDILEQGRDDENEELYSELMYHDQLKATMCENRAFPGFAEGRIAFAPTFKFDKETASYDTSHKQRIPAWTDRILFKPFGTRVLEYKSVPEARHSDHRPVHATFRVSMEGRDLPAKASRKRKRRERRPRSDLN
ncbi:MAG: hypothetical protein SGBAC_002377 [Bacillariaceae sp.]